MTDPKELFVPGESTLLSIGAARIENKIPVAYRLVTKEGAPTYILQGYFTWTQGWGERGGEWRDLETQDLSCAKDDVPFGPLFTNTLEGPAQ